ncbi:hypothetical protein Tco_0047393 [Tanacetum coccineum]
MTEGNTKQYTAGIRVMNYLLQAIPNDIYNSVDASKKASKNHVPLALLTHSNASSSQSHANSSYSSQPYYVTHPSSVVDYNDEYQGELQGDSQEDKLTTTMMMVELTYKPRMQIVLRVQRTESSPRKKNFKFYNCNEKGHYACDCQKPRVPDAKYFREQMLLAMKDEAGSKLNNDENDFMLDTSYGEEAMEELTAAVMLMAQIQTVDGNAETVPSYDANAINEVNALSKVHDQMSHVKHKTIIHTSDDDQIDSNIIFDDLFVENNGGTSEHDSNAHDEYHNIQQEFSVEQTYFSIPSTSNNGSESKDVTSDSPIPKKPKEIESVVQERENIKLEFQKLFNSIKATQTQNQKEVDELIEHVNQKTYAYADVRAQNQDLLMTIFKLKDKLRTIEKGKHVNTKFNKSETLGKLVRVTPFNKNIGNKAMNVSNTKVKTDRSKPVTSHPTPKNERSQKQSVNVITRGMYRIIKSETQTPNSKTNIHVSNSTSVESCNSVRRPKSKGTKSKNRVLKNIKSSSAYVWKISHSVSIDSNKCETKDSNVCQTNASVSNSKTVNAVNDGLNIVWVSCGKDVFLLSHEKCVACYDLSRNSNVKRALFTTPIAVKSKNLGATSVVAKSRLNVVETPKATNKVFSASSLSHDSSQSKTLSNYMKNKIATSQKWQR